MKPIRDILLTVFLTLLVFSAVVYTACNKNHCSKVVCLNRGICDGGACYCPTGFEGQHCEILSRDKFIFTYNGGDLCDTLPYNEYPIHLLAVPHDSLVINMKNFLNNPEDSALCTLQTADSFVFSGNNNSTTYTGTGKLSNDSLFLYYTVVHDTFTYSCTYLGLGLK